MTDKISDAHPTPRDEKLQAIAAVFGAHVAERLGGSGARIANTAPKRSVDPDRLAWQQNKLIQHLRARTETTAPAARQTAPDPTSSASSPTPVIDRLRSAAQSDGLSGEHPAVIAHLLRREPQSVRVSVLRKLPGHTARSVMQRLRST